MYLNVWFKNILLVSQKKKKKKHITRLYKQFKTDMGFLIKIKLITY